MHMFTFSLSIGTYPSEWKRAFVLPLIKKDPAVCFNDFRPITLISVLAKIFDKVVYYKFATFVEENNILDPFQSGYRKHFSTQTSLIKITDDIRENMDNSELTLFVSLDLSHAFNSLEHTLFLSILKSIGCSDLVIAWFKSYLSNRKQRVKTVKGNMSSWSTLPRGTPQGTTLSSLIFALYLNRISEAILTCKRSLYADDLNLYLSTKIVNISQNVELFNRDLANLTIAFKRHGLVVNPRKSCSILFGHSRLLANLSRPEVPRLKINDELLEYKNEIKCLGVILQQNLSWDRQTSEICRKARSQLYACNKLLIYRSLNLKKSLFYAMVMPPNILPLSYV